MSYFTKLVVFVVPATVALAGCAAQGEEESAVSAAEPMQGVQVPIGPGQTAPLPAQNVTTAEGCTIPNSQAPQYGAPTIQAPQYPAPTFGAPNYTAPVFQAPNYQAPQYQTPSAPPSYAAPSYTAPNYAGPTFQAPVYQAPTYVAPTFPAPIYQAPTYQAPLPMLAPQPQPALCGDP